MSACKLHIDVWFGDRTPYQRNVYYVRAEECGALRRLSREIVEIIHANSTPYVVSLPTYRLSFEDAAKLLFETDENPNPNFPRPKELLEFNFARKLTQSLSIVANTTFVSGELHGVYCFCAILRNIHPLRLRGKKMRLLWLRPTTAESQAI